MEITQFVIHNWYLFIVLAVILALLVAGPIGRLVHRVRSVGPSEAVMLINREDGVVLDVRDAKEFHSGHITHALNLPFKELPARLRELEKYKRRPLIVSCAAGERAAKGAILLRRHGFENVAVLAGGMAAWHRGQLPVAK
jgi:rhodanese-related sulfurtransferase